MLPLILSLFAGGGVVLVMIGLNSGESRDSIALRLNSFTSGVPTLREVELAAPTSERVLKPAVERLSRFVKRWQGRDALVKMEKQLLMAGSPNGMTVEDLLGWKGLAALAVSAFGLFGGLVLRTGLMRMIIFAGVGALIGYVLPSLHLKQKIKARQKAILRALPDAIDMLSISVQAGLHFDSALARLSSKLHNELTEEFDRVSAEIRVGKRRRDALRNLTERTGVDDLNSFVNAVIQADQLGVGLANVLKTQSVQLRIRRRQRAEEKARQAPIKMLFPMVGLLFPPLLIVILGPAVPSLMHGMGGH